MSVVIIHRPRDAARSFIQSQLAYSPSPKHAHLKELLDKEILSDTEFEFVKDEVMAMLFSSELHSVDEVTTASA